MGSHWPDLVTKTISDHLDNDQRVTVICRTTPQVDEVRRIIAANGGRMGVTVTTLRGLAASQMKKPIFEGESPEPARPVGNSLLDRVGEDGERPGLEQHLKSLCSTARLNGMTEAEGGKLPEGFYKLVEDGFGMSESEQALRDLFEKHDVDKQHIYCSLGFDSVEPAPWEEPFAKRWLGKDSNMPSRVQPFERALLEKLEAEPLFEISQKNEKTPPAIPACTVPDTLAEARLAVKLLLDWKATADNALVLVPDTLTASRLSDVGARNGLAFSTNPSRPIPGHPLAGLLYDAAEWFADAPQNAIIRASSLERVFGSRIVNGVPRLNRREVNRVLKESRIGEGTMEQWLVRLSSLALAQQGEAKPNTSFARLLARLKRLKTCMLGEPFSADTDQLYEEGPTENDTVTDLEEMAPPDDDELLPAAAESNTNRIPLPNTFGALRRFLADNKLRLRHDPMGSAVLRSLDDLLETPVSIRTLSRALQKDARSGLVRSGIPVMLYEDWDGRSVRDLILLGVHNKGLAASSNPDPFLSTAELHAIGLPCAKDRLVFNLLQAQRAVSRATNIRAVASIRDSSGKAVVPPVQLKLSIEKDAAVAAYGRELALPEFDNNACMEITHKTAMEPEEISALVDPPDPAASGDRTGHLVAQAAIEWYRNGAGEYRLSKWIHDRAETGKPTAIFRDEKGFPVFSLAEALLDQLERPGPDWTAPYLGVIAPPAPENWNLSADGTMKEWSATRQIEAMTNNMYRFLVRQIMKLDDFDEVDDELDAREAGTLIHRVFERLAGEVEPALWRVEDPTNLEAAHRRFETALQTATEAVFEEYIAENGIDNPAVALSTAALGRRWAKRLLKWVPSRIRTCAELRQDSCVQDQVDEGLAKSPLFAPMLENLWVCSAVWKGQAKGSRAKDNNEETARNKLLKHLRWKANPANAALPDSKSSIYGSVKKGSSQRQAYEDFLAGDYYQKNVKKLLSVRDSISTTYGVHFNPIAAIFSEFKFGHDADCPVVLDLGGWKVPLKGSIDRILSIPCKNGIRLQLADYKTGKLFTTRQLYISPTLYNSQLTVYALALDTLIRSGALAEDAFKGAIPGELIYDFPRHDKYPKSNATGSEALAAVALRLGRFEQLLAQGVFVPESTPNGSEFGYPTANPVSLQSAARWVAPIGPPSIPKPSEEEVESTTADNDAGAAS